MKEVLLTSSVLILALTALRFALRGRICSRLQYALWLLAALRLLVPVSIGTSPVSVLGAAEAIPAYVEARQSAGDAPAADENTPSPVPAQDLPMEALYPPQTALPEPALPEPALPALETILRWVWLGGAAGFGLWMLAVNLRFGAQLRRSRWKLYKADGPVPVYVSGAAETPCLFGLLRPAIYLPPSCAEEPTVLRHALAHERAHYRHGDHLWALVRCLCLALYWFDPLVWLAAALSRRDGELSCDESALAALGEEERISYGRTLLALAVRRSGPSPLLHTATTMSMGAGGLKERIRLIAQKPRTLWPAAVLAVGAAVLLAACTFAGTPEAETPVDPTGTSTPSPAVEIRDPLPWEEDPTLLFSIRQVSWWPGGWLDDYERRYTFILAQPEGQSDVWQVIGWLDEAGALYPAEGNPTQADPLQAAMDYAAAYLEGIRNEEDFYLQGTWTSSEEQITTNTAAPSLKVTAVADSSVVVRFTVSRPGDWYYGEQFTLEREIDGIWYKIPVVSDNNSFLLTAYHIQAGEPTVKTYYYRWLYGTLPIGHYRILTGVSNWDVENSDELLAAEFDIP